MKKSLLSIFIITALLGVGINASSQEIAMQIFPIKNPALEKICKLEKFCSKGQLLERYDANEKLALVIEYSPKGTLKIYFPNRGNTRKKITDYGQPAITLYNKNGVWYAGNSPSSGNSYSDNETENQKKIIEKALAFFE